MSEDEKSAAKSEVKPRKPRVAKTAEQKAAALAKAKAKVAALENAIYADQLGKAIAESKIIEAYAQIKSAVNDVNDVVVLKAIAKAALIRDIAIDFIDKKPRKPRKPKEPN